MSNGRWPANVILSPAMAVALNEQSGISKSAVRKPGSGKSKRGSMGGGAMHSAPGGHNDEGGASRFFLQAGYEPWELEWILANGLTPCGAW